VETILEVIAHVIGKSLEIIAIVIVALGALEAVIDLTRQFEAARRLHDTWNVGPRRSWLRFAHWLVVALTFELGADIVATTLSPSWNDLGKLATIAVVRTFLTYFLDRDVEQATALDHAERAA
jgi:uncharacterized membrane protein